MASHDHDFHIPPASIWPPLSCVGLGMAFYGFLISMRFEEFGLSKGFGHKLMAVGLVFLLFTLYKWWGITIKESRKRGYKEKSLVLNLANRYGMFFFIVSEVMFFAAFFAGYFYLKFFQESWAPANIQTLALSLPAINTMILLTSGATLTYAHYALAANKRKACANGVLLTVLLGISFLTLQMYEYGHALFSLSDGVYGSTFYMLTGLHGLHVLVGTLMLAVLYYRLLKGDFSDKEHFYFEGAAWYWHFVDVVWLGLFITVYLF